MSLFDEINRLPSMMTEDERRLLMEEVTQPSQMTKVAEDVIARVQRSAVFKQYIAHLDRGKTGFSVKNLSAWQAEGERQYAALLTASTAIPNGARAVYGLDTEEIEGYPPAKFIATGSAILMLRAQLYLWRADIEDLADEAPMPSHVISQDILPFPFMFWSRDVARGNRTTGETNWTFIAHTSEGFRVVTDAAFSEQDCRISINEIRYGQRWPEDFSENVQRGVGSILKRCSFLNSKYVAPETERLPRQWRKEAERQPTKYPNADPVIRVVKLRRETQEKVDRYREQMQSGRTYTGHWWVSGHHRAQWYPSRETHEVIWIEPYLKGSMEEPELKHVYTVIR